jgi:hypothetical protein
MDFIQLYNFHHINFGYFNVSFLYVDPITPHPPNTLTVSFPGWRIAHVDIELSGVIGEVKRKRCEHLRLTGFTTTARFYFSNDDMYPLRHRLVRKIQKKFIESKVIRRPKIFEDRATGKNFGDMYRYRHLLRILTNPLTKCKVIRRNNPNTDTATGF